MSDRGAEFLRGLAWNLPAAVGGPVDLFEQAINLGLAGGGTALHKLGAIRADQLPKPLEGSVGTTKWWTKGTPLEESADPRFVSGQLAGGLASALFGALPNLKTKPGTLRSLLVPADWPERFDLAKTRPDGTALGRLPGDLPGQEYVALPRTLSADETFSPRNRAQIEQPGGVPLAQLAPEVANSPIEGLRVVSTRNAATPLSPIAGGHLDMANNQAVLRMDDPRSGLPQDPHWLLNALHHEGTHGIDSLAGSVGHGSSPLSADEHTRAIKRLQQNGPEGQKLAQWLQVRRPEAFYRGNLGERRAFVAGDAANMVAPSSATLEVLNRKNTLAYPLNWFTQVQDSRGWFRVPLPAELLRDRRMQFAAPVDGWSGVFLRGQGGALDTDLGILDQRFVLPGTAPGGRSAQSPVRTP